MNPIQIDSKSLIFRLATVYGRLEIWEGRDIDICKFRLASIWGLFVALLVAAALGFFTLCVVDFGIWVTVMAIHKIHIPPDVFAAGGLTAVTLVSVIAGHVGLIALFQYSFGSVKDNLSPGGTLASIGEMYKSAKDKYCAPVEII